jgi:hypothetical protein
MSGLCFHKNQCCDNIDCKKCGRHNNCSKIMTKCYECEGEYCTRCSATMPKCYDCRRNYCISCINEHIQKCTVCDKTELCGDEYCGFCKMPMCFGCLDKHIIECDRCDKTGCTGPLCEHCGRKTCKLCNHCNHFKKCLYCGGEFCDGEHKREFKIFRENYWEEPYLGEEICPVCIDKLDKYDNMKYQYNIMEEKIGKLEAENLHLRYAYGGTGYQEAKEDFDSHI